MTGNRSRMGKHVNPQQPKSPRLLDFFVDVFHRAKFSMQSFMINMLLHARERNKCA